MASSKTDVRPELFSTAVSWSSARTYGKDISPQECKRSAGDTGRKGEEGQGMQPGGGGETRENHWASERTQARPINTHFQHVSDAL